MRTGPLKSLAVLIASAGLALAQAPIAPPPVVYPLDAPQEAAPAAGPAWGAPAPAAPADGDRLWVSAEYLLWWFKKSPVPVPLVTTTSSPDQTPTAGLGVEGTSGVLGFGGVDTGTRQGARFGAGLWLDDRREIGLEGNYLFIASRTVTRSVVSGGGPDSQALAVPFFADDLGTESTFVLASPGALAGGASLSLSSRLQGAELNGLVRVSPEGAFRLAVLGGFRYLELREGLTFTTASVGIQTPDQGDNAGLVLNTVDRFDTENQFYGFQVGARAEYQLGRLLLSAAGKVAVGDMHQVVTVNGSATTNFFNAPAGGPFVGVPVQTIPGAGIFSQATNVGRVSQEQFAAVPELNVTVGYELTDGLRAFVGYDLLYASAVLRPGNQIDRTVTLSQTVQNVVAGGVAATGDRPVAFPTASSFWAQGLTFGVEWRY
jgi:hypothetical protein